MGRIRNVCRSLFFSWNFKHFGFSLFIALIFQVANADFVSYIDGQAYNGFPQNIRANIDDYYTKNPSKASQEVFEKVMNGSQPDYSLKKMFGFDGVGKYGERMSGKIQTTRKLKAGSFGGISKGFGAYLIGELAGAHLANLEAQGISEKLADAAYRGDWLDFWANAARVADWTGLGGSVSDVMRDVDYSPVMEQVEAKARADFENAQRYPKEPLNPDDYPKYCTVTGFIHNKDGSEVPFSDVYDCSKARDIPTFVVKRQDIFGKTFTTRDYTFTFPDDFAEWVNFKINRSNKDDIEKYNAQNRPKFDPARYIPDQALLADLLLRILEDNKRNNADLLNALNRLGTISSSDYSNTEFEPTTITSAPYTDAATGQAQQTKMTVNRDGSIEIEYIPRPDLTPDSSQAPTRTEIPEPTTSTTTAPTTKPIKEGSSTEAPDVCAQNPNSVMCLDAGPVDYEDPILPTHQVNVSFEPSNIFNTDGVCPKPYPFSIGRFYEGEISFQAACDAAYKIRPMFILCAMFISAFMVYGAIKEMK